MRNRTARKTARLGIFLEPELRAAIENESARRHAPISYVVRALLREQLAALSAGKVAA